MAQINRSPAQQRIARSIAISRSIAARNVQSRRPARSRAEPSVSKVAITMILVDNWSKGDIDATLYVFEDVAQMQRELSLDCVHGLQIEIAEEAVDGTIYAALDPHSADIRGIRTLLIASNPGELERRHDLACDEI